MGAETAARAAAADAAWAARISWRASTTPATSAAALNSSTARTSASRSAAALAARRSHFSASVSSPRSHSVVAADSAQCTSSKSVGWGAGMTTGRPERVLERTVIRRLSQERGPGSNHRRIDSARYTPSVFTGAPRYSAGMLGESSSRISALLGPTNTGKTHRAVERMLEHGSGMIGLPLRLLAREIYDRVTARLGEKAAALVTGEEKRIPRNPRYWICTVESMPIDREVDFVAIDEIQLVAHPQRGHVFTDRLLNARGREETWLCGADTMRPLMQTLVPTASIRRHPRLSRLSRAGTHGLAALPPRTAVIAFSAAEVYHIADRLRRRRGGAAVVLGALSPRTRNAQVAMYQAGEVDFLVATDAVGMGLNMDVDHVAFATLRKFDGFRMRALTPAEVGQIAGRAGRYTHDGTFGTLSPLELADDIAFSVESHRFAPVRQAMWRNADLDTSSVAALKSSLGARPRRPGLSLVHTAADQAVLEILAERDDVKARTRTQAGVELLWDVCRIPDFRKLLAEHHAVLLAEIFVQLSDRRRLDPDFMDERIERLEHTTGDIDDLMMRMDFIRTWAYVAYHADWVSDPLGWQERTRRAEDRLSEALHERLVERFVERTSKGRRSARRSHKGGQAAVIERAIPDGPFSQLAALRDALKPEPVEVVRDEWVEQVIDARHERFDVTSEGLVMYAGDDERFERLARLTRGVDILHPEVKMDPARPLGAGAQSRILRRLRAWSRDFIDDVLGPLRDPRVLGLSAAARGLTYQLERGLTTIATHQARDQIRDLEPADRRTFDDLDIAIGDRFAYAALSLDHASVVRRAALATAWFGRTLDVRGAAMPWPEERDEAQLLTLGYAHLGAHAVRVDVVDELLAIVGPLAEGPPFSVPSELVSLTTLSTDDVERLLLALGFTAVAEGFIKPARASRRRRSRRGRR